MLSPGPKCVPWNARLTKYFVGVGEVRGQISLGSCIVLPVWVYGSGEKACTAALTALSFNIPTPTVQKAVSSSLTQTYLTAKPLFPLFYEPSKAWTNKRHTTHNLWVVPFLTSPEGTDLNCSVTVRLWGCLVQAVSRLVGFPKGPQHSFISRNRDLTLLVMRGEELPKPHMEPYLVGKLNSPIVTSVASDRHLLKTPLARKETYRLVCLENPGICFKHSWIQLCW